MIGKHVIGLATLLALVFVNSIGAQEQHSTLKNEDLKALLTGLGYDGIKEFKNKDGEVTGAWFVMKGQGYTLPVIFELSQNKKYLWVTVRLFKLPDPKVPASVLHEFMTVNRGLGLGKFSFDAKNNVFEYTVSIYNLDITPSYMREILDYKMGEVYKFAKLWDYAKWNTES